MAVEALQQLICKTMDIFICLFFSVFSYFQTGLCRARNVFFFSFYSANNYFHEIMPFILNNYCTKK